MYVLATLTAVGYSQLKLTDENSLALNADYVDTA